ncbi:hypothetical protein FNF29_01856 [Cafeteria roenbergensis]|uniref:Uncharacterized protein n=1 Tax=Cafeteria roenbergensis TaxID=33653 RepID=A0A5A8CQY5_CAFRO|nr:hypothetical protein FNF29_01856 [Cafeteria roenbergensis]|eukprot:KAA0155483.1 hypothetical protein FNF29_01856 [Cafeteria roenbergensis]
MSATRIGKPPSLTSAVVELGEWRRHMERQLQAIVSEARGENAGVVVAIDVALIPLLRLILTEGGNAVDTLAPHGMQGDFLVLGSGGVPAEASAVLFLIRPSAEAAHHVRDLLLHARRTTELWTPSVCFVPRRSFDCEAVWQAAGVWSSLAVVTELACPLAPWDDDVLTMEWPSLWADACSRSSPVAAEQVAQSLLDIQTVFGHIPDIKAKGDVSCQAVQLMLTKRRQQTLEAEDAAEAAAAAVGGSSAAPPPAATSLAARAVAAAAGVGLAATGTAPGAGASSGAQGGAAAAAASAGGAGGAGGGGHVGGAGGGAGGSEAARAETVKCGAISAAILIDRNVDPVTPLIHSLTVEALLDDLVGLSAGLARVSHDIAFGSSADGDGAAAGGAGAAAASDASAEGGAGAGGVPRPPVEVFFNSDDNEWVGVRDVHIHAAGQLINRRSQELQAFKDLAKTLRDKDVAAMRDYVSSMRDFEKAKQALPRVLRLVKLLKQEAERPDFMGEWHCMSDPFLGGGNKATKAMAEKLVASRSMPHRPLRLACLSAASEGGMRQHDLDSLRKALAESYGFDFAMVPDTLEAMGLLRVNRAGGIFATSSSSDWNWPTLMSTLRLGEDFGDDERDPQDISFVTSCIAPLSVRLVQAALALPIGKDAMKALGGDEVGASSFPPQGGWSAIEPALKACPGRWLECLQLVGPKSMARKVGVSAIGGPAGAAAGSATMAGRIPASARGGSAGAAADDGREDLVEEEPRKTVLVYFVGGVTFAEVAALRWLGERLPFDFLIATTHITSGRKLMEQAVEASQMGGSVDLVPDSS